MKAFISDAMRIEILYRFGGVYCDFKVEGRKPFDPFLKYGQSYLLIENHIYN